MPTEYVQKRHGVYRITDTRVSLDAIVYTWWAGHSASWEQPDIFNHTVLAFIQRVDRQARSVA